MQFQSKLFEEKMEDKELEQKLEKSVDDIEVRDFSLIWNDIKGRVAPKRQANKRRLTGWIASVAALVCVTVVCSIILPMVITQNNEEPEITYFMEELGSVASDESQFYQELAQANIKHVDFSRYVGLYHVLFQTENGQTKGGSIELMDDLDNATFILDVQFYDDKVKIKEPSTALEVFDLNYEVNGARIEYRVKEAYPEDSWYVYELKANYNSVNYYMEYTCFTEDIKPFLDEFFK